MPRVLASVLLFFLVFAVGISEGHADDQNSASSSSEIQEFFPLEDLKPGLKGTARTVFSGSDPEDFGVEILGVLPGFPGPRQSVIIARISGPAIERTGVFAGMSGSPVYIDGKLVGAIAFSFPFAKEPIAGITPIRQMIEIFERGADEGRGDQKEPRSVTFTQLASTEWKPAFPKPAVTAAPFFAPVTAGSPLTALIGQQLAPIATPLVFSGISQESLQLFSDQLIANGLLPVSGIGGAAPITPLAPSNEKTLAPGASVSVQLVRGDYSIAASGTVTLRNGKAIYAFGHPFLSLGAADMPMTESSVVTVVPNANNSFKLAVPGKMVGSVSQDRASGILGQLDQAPRMIPVKINLRTSRGRLETYKYEVASDSFLTPLLVNLTVYSTITSSERSVGESTLSVKGKIDVNGHPSIAIDQRFSAMNAPGLAAGSIAVPVAALLSSGFENLEVRALEVDITSSDSKHTASLERIAIDRTEVGRGEKIEIQAFVRTESGKQFVQRIPLTIPEDVPRGKLVLFVGDGGALQQASGAQAFVPQDIGQLVQAINKIRKVGRLYVRLLRTNPGAVIGTNELPNLPPSVVATLNSDRTSGGYTPINLSPVYEAELPPADFLISGQQMISIEVVR